MAVITLAGAGLIAAGPTTPTPPPAIPVARPAVQLTAGVEDLANIPLNLFYALANAPANYLRAIDEYSYAQFFSGPWLVGSPLNIWGIDVGDPPRIQALVDMLIPFPALSKPLGEQIIGFLQAEFPSNSSCDAVSCSLEGWLNLFNGYAKVPLSELLNGYTFPESGPTVEDPYGPADGALGFPGTTVAPDGTDVYPWAGTTFTLDLAKPWNEFFDSLTAPPPTDPFVEFPNVFQTMVNFAMSWYVMYNPFLPGGTYIPDLPWIDPDGPAAADFTAPFDGGDWTSLLT
jgi:hypothetical protein